MIGSLFSGIGGLELGLERAGLGPVIWQAEADPFCRRVLAKHWPETHRYEDVREIDETAERPDIICGGFPCQDISLAGKGAGLAGKRSGLWFEYARIVRDLRPRIVIVENVSALLGRGLGIVLGDLAALGYDAFWDCIPAAAIGAPHRRDRLFLVAWRVSDTERGGVREEPGRRSGGGNGRPTAESRDVGAAVADTPRQLRDGSGEPGPGRRRQHPDGSSAALADPERHRPQGQFETWAATGAVVGGGNLPTWPPPPNDLHAWGRVPADVTPAFCRLADGVSADLAGRSAKLKALGNAVVPAVAELIGRAIVNAGLSEQRRADGARGGW